MHFYFTFDCRSQLQPQLSLTYIGNYLFGCFSELKVKILVKVSKAGIEDLEECGVLSDVVGLIKNVRALSKKQPLVVARSQMDFSFKQPKLIRCNSATSEILWLEDLKEKNKDDVKNYWLAWNAMSTI